MSRTPLVTIVTPSYNQAQFLEETILSVLNQDYPNVEYIIIDGGSTDGSVETIKKYGSDITYWVSEPDQGQTDAVNKGFEVATGEILAWLNSDDIYYPNAVKDAVDFLFNNPDVGMVYGDCDLIDGDGDIQGQFDARQTHYRRLMRGHGNIPQPASFWRRSLWDRVGPLDISFQFAMDFDLWLRFARVTEIRYVPQRWAGFRMHEEAKTNQIYDHCWPEMKKAHYKQGGRVISVFTWKYWLRLLMGPVVRWIKNFLLQENC